MRLTYFTDRAHGWLAVPHADLQSLAMSASDFSGYSYLTDGAIYLEEDCDASKFIAAYVAARGEMPAIVENHCDGSSHIRNYPRNTAETRAYLAAPAD